MSTQALPPVSRVRGTAAKGMVAAEGGVLRKLPLGRKVRGAEILSLRTVAERLDARITWRGGEVPPRGTWKTVASELGTSPEALYRELARRRAPGTARSRPKRGK